MIKALIIDDEKLARDLVKSFLAPRPQIKVVGECTNGFDGLKAIQQLKPDLIFLDVQMPKLNGFEMLELLDDVPVIIFSTAFEQYAIKAFEISAADYLLKPYSRERFDEALEKALQKIETAPDQEKMAGQLVEQSRQCVEEIERIVVRVGNKVIIIPTSNIEYIEAQDDYVNVFTAGKKYLKQMTMKYLEGVLSKNQFVRVHRSFIVNIHFLDRLEAYSKDTYVAILKNGAKLSVSRAGYGALKEVLGI